MENKRIIGLDLLRILAMISITSIHFICYSQIGSHLHEIPPYNRLFITMLNALDSNFVNIFVLLTGYLSYGRHLSYKKIIRLLLQVWFVSVAVSISVAVIAPSEISYKGILRTFFPMLTGSYWYIVTYMMLFFAMPLYNKIIDNTSHETLKRWLITAVIFATLYLTANPIIDEKTFIGADTTFLWFSFIYFIGAYFNKYPFKIDGRKVLCVSAMLYVITVVALWFGLSRIAGIKLLGGTAIITLFLSVCLLISSSKISSSRKLPILETMSASALCVYLVQENSLFRFCFWRLIDVDNYSNSWMLIIDWLAAQLFLWVSAIIVYKLYKVANKYFLYKIEDFIYDKVVTLVHKVK